MIMTHLKPRLYAGNYFQNFHLQSLLHLSVHATPTGIKKTYRQKTQNEIILYLQALVKHIYIKLNLKK